MTNADQRFRVSDDNPGIFQTHHADKQADTAGDTDAQAHRNIGDHPVAYTENRQQQQTDGAAQELFGTRQAQEQGAENTENGVWEQPQDAAQDPYAQTPTDDPWQKNE